MDNKELIAKIKAYQYESVDELGYDMEEIMSLRLKLN